MQPDAAANFYAENRYLIKAVLGLATTISLAAIFLPRLAHIASRIGLVDLPGKRKTHAGAKPLVGGLGMSMALAVTCLVFVPLANLRGFYAGFVLLVIIGFLDDFRELRYGGKFIAQIFAALFMVYFSNMLLASFGNLIGVGAIHFGIMAVPLTIFCTVGVINAFNMVDGLDGLAGGIALVAFLTFALLSYLNAQPDLALLAIAFSGALIGFLWYNRPPSRLFMGDAGSMSIGFALVFFSLAVTQKAGGSVSPATPLLILAVPICDTIRIIFDRLLRGRSPFAADNKHLHHLLLRFGFNRKRTALIIIGLSAAFALFSVAGTLLRMPDYLFFALFMIYGGIYVVISASMRSIIIAKLKLKKEGSEQYRAGSRLKKIMLVLAMSARIIRRERRIVVKAPVACTYRWGNVEGELTDLNTAGFSAVFVEKLAIGDMARFELRLPKLASGLEVSAQVIWTERTSAGCKYGFRFVSIGGPEAEMIRLYLTNP